MYIAHFHLFLHYMFLDHNLDMLFLRKGKKKKKKDKKKKKKEKKRKRNYVGMLNQNNQKHIDHNFHQ